MVCLALPPSGTPAPSASPRPASSADARSGIDARVRELVVRLEIPTPTVELGPEPAHNEWNMAVVGLPLWTWLDSPDTVSATITDAGVTFSLSAHRQGVTFDFGDDSPAVRCTTMTRYPGATVAGQPSPVCGHTYTRPSLPNGPYTIHAEAHWLVTWSAAGYTGTIPVSIHDERLVDVGELQSVLVPAKTR